MTTVTDIDRTLEAAVAAGNVPGVVAVAADHTGAIYTGAFGRRALDEPARMTVDTVFWIASMTKAVTSVAAMQLVEQGRLALDEPLGGLLPGLASPQVLAGFDPAGEPILRPARRPITLRHLLTHTAGFGYDTWNDDLRRYAAHVRIPPLASGRAAALDMPLAFDPGERWQYGINIDWVGRAVEVASGERLDAYFRHNIFAPLGMDDTGFVPGAAQRARFAGMHQRRPDGRLERTAYTTPENPEHHFGGGGLFSTAPDYLAFLRMLLNGGRLPSEEGDRADVLRPETVALMAQNHIGDLQAGIVKTAIPERSNDVDLFPGMPQRWGLGFLINTEPGPAGRSAGSLAWAGLRNTYYWLDPTHRIAGVLLTQILPFGDAAVLDLLAAFERGIYGLERR